MQEGKGRDLIRGAALCLGSLTLATAGATIPLVGVLFGLLTPLPLILLSLRHGRIPAVLGVLAVGASLVPLLGVRYAWVFCLEFGWPALVIAEGIRRKWAPEPSVAAGVLAVLGGSLLGLLLLSRGTSGPIEYLLNHFDLALQEAMDLYSRMGLVSEEVGQISASAGQVRHFLLATSPGLFVSAAVISTFINYFIARSGWARSSEIAGPDPGFSWNMPDWLVWVLIGAAGLLLSGLPIAKEIGLNGLLVMITLYVLQGLAIAAFWIRRLKLPPLAWILGVVVLLFQPVLVLLLAGVGLFDIWCVFRRQTLPGPPGA